MEQVVGWTAPGVPELNTAAVDTLLMATVAPDSTPSVGRSLLLATGIGIGVFLCFLVAGLLFGSWDVGEFLSELSFATVGWLLLLGGMTIATFAIPIALYLHSRLVAPLALLGLVIVGWPAYGIVSGILGSGTIFGLSLYAVGLAPLYVVLYLVLGGGEYFVRTRGQA